MNHLNQNQKQTYSTGHENNPRNSGPGRGGGTSNGAARWSNNSNQSSQQYNQQQQYNHNQHNQHNQQ